MLPYIQFSSNGVSMKVCRDASRLLLSLLLLFIYFLALPSRLISSIYLLFILVYACILSSVATQSEGCGLVHCLWYAVMCRHGQVSWCSLPKKSQSLHASTSLAWPQTATINDRHWVWDYLHPWSCWAQWVLLEKGALGGALTVSIPNFNSLAIVAIACPRLLADCWHDSMELANWSQSRT